MPFKIFENWFGKKTKDLSFDTNAQDILYLLNARVFSLWIVQLKGC